MKSKKLFAYAVWVVFCTIIIYNGIHLYHRSGIKENPTIKTLGSVDTTKNASNPSVQVLQQIQQHGGKMDVYMEKRYVCGELVQHFGTMTPQEIQNYFDNHPQMKVEWNRDNKVTLKENIADLSPQCKENAYFGIDQQGNLSLFQGVPSQDHVIKTFFQINIKYLISSLPKDAWNQLQKGIRITDVDEYNSVLSTFSEYATGTKKR